MDKYHILLEITIVSECCALYCLHRSIPWFRSLHSFSCDARQIGILALSQLTIGEQRCDVNVLLLPLKVNPNHSDAISKAADRSHFANLLKTDRKTYKNRESITPSEMTLRGNRWLLAAINLGSNNLEGFWLAHYKFVPFLA